MSRVKAGLFRSTCFKRDCSSRSRPLTRLTEGRDEFRGNEEERRDKRRINRELIAVVRGDGYQGIVRGE